MRTHIVSDSEYRKILEDLGAKIQFHERYINGVKIEIISGGPYYPSINQRDLELILAKAPAHWPYTQGA